MLTRPLDQITARAVDWLWPGYLALGKLTLLDGDPGLGKSLITLDLAACLSAGRPWPDGAPARDPANSVIIGTEDNDAVTAPPSLAYRLNTQPAGPPSLTWLGSSPYSVDQLLRQRVQSMSPERTRACHFLAEFLKTGPRTSRELWYEARRQGLSRRTMLRARGDLEVKCKTIPIRGQAVTLWLLAGQEAKEWVREQGWGEHQKV